MRTIYWSEFNRWANDCARWWYYEYIEKLPKAEPSPAMLEGKRIAERLAERLRDVAGFKPGRDPLLKEYHERYKATDLPVLWAAETPFSCQFGGESELACIADGYRPGLVRETKVTQQATFHRCLHQLLWNCYCAGTSQGELDLILMPGYSRANYAFERHSFTFEDADFEQLRADIDDFLDATRPHAPQYFSRSSSSCQYCPHTERCWSPICR